MHQDRDTIVAVSSPPGRSARGLVRLSGPATRTILTTITDGPVPAARHLTRLNIVLPTQGGQTHLPSRGFPALITFFAGPQSYTGDDMAELQLPGHPALLERMLQGMIALGARLAEPGEFTFRAFLAGKIDLTQAEGVAATIAAVSDGQLRAADQLRRGQLGRFASEAVDSLATQLALVEAGIDFVDQDDVVPISPAALAGNLAALQGRLDDLLRHSRAWGALEALPRVVLVGDPSSGKSTLFNALLGRARAVVSATPGTTRDVLEEPLRLGDGEVMLVDLAGLDAGASGLDAQAQEAAAQAIANADLLLLCDDGQSTTSHARQFLASASNTSAQRTTSSTAILRVRTKADLEIVSSVGFDAAKGAAPDYDVAVSVISAIGAVNANSAAATTGLDKLRQLITDHLSQGSVSVVGEALALQPRHERSLRAAARMIEAARHRLEPHVSRRALPEVELLAAELREALDELAGLGGQMTPDDVIGRVFATFCVGK